MGRRQRLILLRAPRGRAAGLTTGRRTLRTELTARLALRTEAALLPAGAAELRAALKVAAEALESSFFDGAGNVTQLELKIQNGSRLIFLPANPRTARGYSGNVFLDEFAFHFCTEFKRPLRNDGNVGPSVTRVTSIEIGRSPGNCNDGEMASF